MFAEIEKNGLRFEKVWQGWAWAMVAVVVWLSLTPYPPQPPSFLDWDKAQHCVAYAGLMYWFGMSFVRHWRWPVFLIALGVGLEFLQGFGGIRTFDAFDMLANSLGVLIGLFMARSSMGQWLAVLDKALAG
ncbi:MAG: VanZ family protein [Methylococcaceae bacterium]|nr:VanZ family protein [Methylococcaceae bacterium]